MGTATTRDVGDESARDPTDKQRRILAYLREHAGDRTYFKSRRIAEDLGMTAKEVGANIGSIRARECDLTVEKWGYSSGTTWRVTL